MSGWWAENYAHFTLAFTPTVTTTGHGKATASVNLPVSPSFAMAPTSVSTAEMTLPVEASVSFVGVAYRADYALNITPEIGMGAAGTSTAAFNVIITPSFGMTGVEKYTGSFTLAVVPAFPFTGATKQLPHAIPWTI